MSSPEELVMAAHHFLADRLSFDELYLLALTTDSDVHHAQAGTLADRLSGAILLVEGEITAGGRSPSEIRAVVADVLLADALAHLEVSRPR
jgi:hypothetical protein